MGREAELQQQVLERAASDQAFRSQLKSDPRAAIREATGVDLPEGINIRVLEDGPSDVTVVLPPATSGVKLSDEELASVAGGGNTACSLGTTCGALSIWGQCIKG